MRTLGGGVMLALVSAMTGVAEAQARFSSGYRPTYRTYSSSGDDGGLTLVVVIVVGVLFVLYVLAMILMFLWVMWKARKQNALRLDLVMPVDDSERDALLGAWECTRGSEHRITEEDAERFDQLKMVLYRCVDRVEQVAYEGELLKTAPARAQLEQWQSAPPVEGAPGRRRLISLYVSWHGDRSRFPEVVRREDVGDVIDVLLAISDGAITYVGVKNQAVPTPQAMGERELKFITL